MESQIQKAKKLPLIKNNYYHQNRNAESTKYLAEISWILIHLADDRANGAFVVTSNPNHRKILLFNNIDILNKFKIFKHIRDRKF